MLALLLHLLLLRLLLLRGLLLLRLLLKRVVALFLFLSGQTGSRGYEFGVGHVHERYGLVLDCGLVGSAVGEPTTTQHGLCNRSAELCLLEDVLTREAGGLLGMRVSLGPLLGHTDLITLHGPAAVLHIPRVGRVDVLSERAGVASHIGVGLGLLAKVILVHCPGVLSAALGCLSDGLTVPSGALAHDQVNLSLLLGVPAILKSLPKRLYKERITNQGRKVAPS